MKVAFTSYPVGRREATRWEDLPFPPAVGDTIMFDDDDIPCVHVTHVSWVQEGNQWHLECSVS